MAVDFTTKVFAVTVTGTDWNGQAITVTTKVETHGDAEWAKRVVVTQDFPAQVRKADAWTVERVG